MVARSNVVARQHNVHHGYLEICHVWNISKVKGFMVGLLQYIPVLTGFKL